MSHRTFRRSDTGALQTEPLLSVMGLTVALRDSTAHDDVLVRGVSFDVGAGERIGLIGESGSGKSLTAVALLGLLPESMRASGQVRLDGNDVMGYSPRQWESVRGSEIGIIFQEPLSALDPLMKIRRQIALPVRLHDGLTGRDADKRIRELLARVQINDVDRIMEAYPHMLSGGQRQRVAMAMTLACRPRLLIADEATTALDVTVQAEVVDLLLRIVSEDGMSLIFITHDLPLVANVATRILVMRRGEIVESAGTDQILTDPGHEYTRMLLAAAHEVTDVLDVATGPRGAADDETEERR